MIFLYASQFILSGCTGENAMKQHNNATQDNESAIRGSMKPDIESVMATYKKMGKNGWNVKGPLKWGFFFFSKSRDNLDKIYSELKDYHYSLDRIEKNDDGEWVLQVSKIEVLAPEKLHRRNVSFVDLAEKYDSIYDGWDVGKSKAKNTGSASFLSLNAIPPHPLRSLNFSEQSCLISFFHGSKFLHSSFTCSRHKTCQQGSKSFLSRGIIHI